MRAAWPFARKRGRVPIGAAFTKSAFAIHLAEARVICPAQQTARISRGAATVHFAAAGCQRCAVRAACTTARGGRSIAIHPQEALLSVAPCAPATAGGPDAAPAADKLHRIGKFYVFLREIRPELLSGAKLLWNLPADRGGHAP